MELSVIDETKQNQLKAAFKAYGLILIFFISLAAIVFRSGFGEDMVFSGSDANIGILTVHNRQLPDYFSGGYLPAPVFGGAGEKAVTFSNIGKWLLKPATFSNTWYSLYLLISSVAFIAYVRLWKVGWLSAVLGALCAFWVGSVTLSAAGHLYKLGVMAFFMVSLLLLECSLRSEKMLKAGSFACLAGFFVGLMLLEQQDVGLLAGIFLGMYGVVRIIDLHKFDWKRWVVIFLPIALIGISMTLKTAVKAYDQNVVKTTMASDADEKWEFVTQWSMVPAEIPDLFAPGYMGWKTGDASGPYWGKVGQSPEWETQKKGFRNFRLDSLYFGFIPVLIAMFGFAVTIPHFRNEESYRVFFLWGIMAVAALLLSFGKFSPVYKLFYQLPLVGNIRAPIKFLHNFQVIIGLLTAFGINHLLSSEPEARRRKSRVLVLVSGTFAFIAIMLSISAKSSALLTEFAEWGQYASVIVKNISKAWMHAGFMALLVVGIALCFWKGWKLPRYLPAGLLIVAVTFDAIYLTSKYFHAVDISSLRKGNVVINYLKQHQGDERICFADQSGVYNNWLGMEVAYHGLQTFNIWQMPRMPAEYKEFFKSVGKNQIRMWQLASVKYVTAPASILGQFEQNAKLKSMFEPIMFYRFGMQDEELVVMPILKPEDPGRDQVLLQFNAHVPRFALYTDWITLPAEDHCKKLASSTFDPLNKVAVAEDLNGQAKSGQMIGVDAATSMKNAVIQTDSEHDGVLLFTQRYQPGWSVYVDGQQAKLLRCNYLCMGVFVPAGKHEVRFEY